MDIEYISLTNENGNTTAINTLDKSFNTKLGNVISKENRQQSLTIVTILGQSSPTHSEKRIGKAARATRLQLVASGVKRKRPRFVFNYLS